MKLLNYTSAYFSFILMIIIPIWAGLFYYAMLDEVYDSMDDGLDNQRLLIISKIVKDSTVLNKENFEEGNYSISPTSETKARKHKDIYLDTLMYMQNEKDYEPVRMLQTVIKKDDRYYQMRVITSMVEEDDLITELTNALLWLYFGLVLTIIILNNSLLRNIWKPFYLLINQLKAFKLNNAQPLVLARTNIDEFNLMQDTIQRFLNTNVAAYNKQKQFIENASHELQTPLAIALNKLELLAENNHLNPSQADLLHSALNNLERLKRLNQSLLLISKIENDQFDKTVEVDINALTTTLIEDFNEQAGFYNLKLNLINRGSCTWMMNPDLADILISNLIKNAIKHTAKGNSIDIIISEGQFAIENSGEKPLDKQVIFQRFYKGSSSSESTGLGLAIARAVSSVSQLTLDYIYDGKHVFKINKKE
ncbi:sensor histidine kinase [Paradesertivirga mongoliensis]|uniref:histidine kinase n=1 Tax=Paradesertivirga mongoliensis TaxID=2100740 RepID=A0ABW4ZS02_9SPHI|nr:HAMP domain-containing sensor histidine kinase [Pedobacter mongoliensis]